MKIFIYFSIVMVAMTIYGLQYKENESQLKNSEIRFPVKATFSPREATEDPKDTCFQLEGSKRSFHNTKNFNENTVFEIVKVIDDFGESCVRKILVDGKIFEEPSDGHHCIDYKIPPTECRGRHCVRVYDFCI